MGSTAASLRRQFTLCLSRFSGFFPDKLLSSLLSIPHPTAGTGRIHTHTRVLSFSPQVHPVPQTRPRFVDPFRLVLSPRSCSRSKLRLPTALGVSRKSRRELYLSLERRERERERKVGTGGGGEKGSKGEPVSRFPAGARYWSRRGAPWRNKAIRDTGSRCIPLSVRFMIYLPIADARRDKLAVIL